jgi:predicted MFS family arabinose efflux permease
VIGISVIFSSLGSVAALLLSDRIGLRVPISAAILVMAAAICGMLLASSSQMLFLVYISLLQIGWIFLNCYLYTAVIKANNLLVPATTPISTVGSVLGASCMGYVLEHGALSGALVLCLGSILLTSLLTLPFLGTHTRFGDAKPI